MRPIERVRMRARQLGFTLLEVLVALIIVALGMSALLEMLSQSAANVSALRDKTAAEWIALNQIALARLALTAPTTGSTQGEVQNCANGNWHWQQQINAVDAIPGLLSITVSVRRTGNATPTQQQSSSISGANSPGATGSLGANATLGPTAQLGSASSLSTAGCASVTSAGSSLGGSLGGSLGNNSAPSLSGAPSLGANSFGAGSLGSPDASSVGDSISANVSSAMNGRAGSSSADDSAPPSWLVTLTGFRGNSLGAASGESPDWNGAAANGAGATTNTGLGSPRSNAGLNP